MNHLEEWTIESLKKALKQVIGIDLTKNEELIARQCYKEWYKDAKKVFNDWEVKVTRV